jgi:hypothetical protein
VDVFSLEFWREKKCMWNSKDSKEEENKKKTIKTIFFYSEGYKSKWANKKI